MTHSLSTQIIAILSVATNGGIVFFTRNPVVFASDASFEAAAMNFLVFQYFMWIVVGMYICVFQVMRIEWCAVLY